MQGTFTHRAEPHVVSSEGVFTLRADIFNGHSAAPKYQSQAEEYRNNEPKPKNNDQHTHALNQATRPGHFSLFFDLIFLGELWREIWRGLGLIGPQEDFLPAMRARGFLPFCITRKFNRPVAIPAIHPQIIHIKRVDTFPFYDEPQIKSKET